MTSTIKLLKDDIKKERISDELITSVVTDYIIRHHLYNDIKELQFTDIIDSFGIYFPKSKSIYLNLVLIKKQSVNYEDFLNELLITVYHELTHVNQQYTYGKYLYTSKIMETEARIMEQCDSDEYIEYHDLFSSEHNANALGAFETYKLYKSSGINTDKMSIIFKGYLLDNYNDSFESPIETLYREVKYNPKISMTDYITKYHIGLCNRLLYGLPISNCEFEEVWNDDYERSTEPYVSKKSR